MKIALAFVVGCLAVVTVSSSETYTTKWDNIDLDQILHSDRLLNNYCNCLLDKGNCTPDGKELKMYLPDAILNECAKCSEKQKNGAKKVIAYVRKNKPKIWAELVAKYDPEGTYEKKYADLL